MTPLILIRDHTHPPHYITHFLYSRLFPVALPLSLGSISPTHTHFLSIAVTHSLFFSSIMFLSLTHTQHLSLSFISLYRSLSLYFCSLSSSSPLFLSLSLIFLYSCSCQGQFQLQGIILPLSTVYRLFGIICGKKGVCDYWRIR